MTQSLTRRRLSGIISDSNREVETSVKLSRTSNQRTLKDNAKKFFNPKAPQLPESGIGSRETSTRYNDIRNNDSDDDITKLKSNLEVLSVATGSPSSDRPLLLSTRQSQSNESHKHKNDLTLPILANNSYHNSMTSESSTRRCSDSQKSSQLSKISMSRLEVGLQNLGNTCFMNSSLQCLLHIEPLVSYFLNGQYHQDLNTSSPMKGSLALSFAQLIQEVTSSTSGAVVSPVHFQKAVSCHAPHLLDFQQQDCQEFLRFLLDGMSEDLCRSSPPNTNNNNNTMTRRKSLQSLQSLPTAAGTGVVQAMPQQQQQQQPHDRSSSPQTVVTRGSETSVRRYAILHAMPVNIADGGGGGVKQQVVVEGNKTMDQIEPQFSQSLPVSLDKLQISPPSTSKESNNNNNNNNNNTAEGGHLPSSSSVMRLREVTASSRTHSDDVPDTADRMLIAARESEKTTTGTVAIPLSNQDNEEDQRGGFIRHGSRGIVHRRRRRLSKGSEMGTGSHTHNYNSNQTSHRTAILQAATNQDPESPSNSTASTALMTSMDSDMETSMRSTKSLRKSFLVPTSNEPTNSLTTTITTTTINGTSHPTMITDINSSTPEISDDLKKIYEESRKGWENYLQRNDSVVTDIFAGQLQGTVQCHTCKNRSHCFDPFLDISVPIPKISELRTTTTSTKSWRRSSSMGDAIKCTLDECLEKFSSEEVLEGDNAVMCEVCKKKTKSVKRLSIYQHPKVLVIHIKRFRYTTFLREKLSTDVSFPLTGLDLTPYLSKDIIPLPSTLPTSSTTTTTTTTAGGNGGVPSSTATVTGTGTGTGGPRSVLYDLVGVSHHSGSMNGGHYIAHVDTSCGSGGASRWMCFNDARVSSVNVSNLSGPSAYVLFYKLREER